MGGVKNFASASLSGRGEKKAHDKNEHGPRFGAKVMGMGLQLL